MRQQTPKAVYFIDLRACVIRARGWSPPLFITHWKLPFPCSFLSELSRTFVTSSFMPAVVHSFWHMVRVLPPLLPLTAHKAAGKKQRNKAELQWECVLWMIADHLLVFVNWNKERAGVKKWSNKKLSWNQNSAEIWKTHRKFWIACHAGLASICIRMPATEEIS